MRIFLVLLMTIIVSQSCSLDQNTVAAVGDYKITKDEFITYMTNRYGQKESYKSVSEKDKKAILDQLILRKQKLNDAYDSGLDEDQEFQIEYISRKRQMLSNIYFEKTIVDKMVPDSLIKAEFEKTRYEINASHVLLSFAGLQRSMNPRSKKEAYELAKKISDMVRAGSDISAIAMEYSDDRTKMENKGNLGYFTWGKMVDEFQEAAYNMEVNEVSDPVLSEFGYHVIYINDKRENANFDMANLEKERDNIKKRIYYKNRSHVLPIWEKHLKELKEKKDFKILSHNIKEFVSNNKALDLKDTLSAETVKEKNGSLLLAEWDGGNCSAVDFFYSNLKRYNNNISRFKNIILDSLKTSKDTELFANHVFISQVSEELGYLDEKNIKEQLDNFLESSMISLAEKESVPKDIDITDDEMIKYYSENKSEFTLPEKMEMWEIYITDEKKANQVYERALSGENFEKLAKQYSEEKESAKNNGQLGYRTKTSRGVVSRKAFDAGTNQLIKPFKQKKGWIIVKTGDMQENVFRSYEESEKQIRNKIRTNKLKEKREEWELYLAKTYPADINSDLIASI